MCFESERNPRCSSPSVKNIADIASCSYRAYKLCRRGCRLLKREYTSYMNSHRKREDGLRMHIHMKPWTTQANATHANTTEANTTNAPRPSADEERNFIRVNVVERKLPTPSELQGLGTEALEMYKHIKSIMKWDGEEPNTTMPDDEEPNTTTPDGEEPNTTTGDGEELNTTTGDGEEMNTTTKNGEEPNTTTRDGEELKTTTLDRTKLGVLEEALCAHPPTTMKRLDATRPDDLEKLEMRFDHARATRCAV